MGSLLARVLPLAFGAAFSPTLLTLQVLILAGKRRPLARAWVTAAGCLLDLAAFTALGFLLMRQIPAPGSGAATATAAVPHTSPVSAVIKLTVALVLVVLGVRQVVKRDGAADAHRSNTSTRLETAGLGFFLGAGVVAMALNVTTLVLYIPAVHDIVESAVDVAAKAVVVAILVAITLLPVVLPPLGISLMGARAQPALDFLNGFAGRHMRAINASICFVFAVLLAWQGLRALP